MRRHTFDPLSFLAGLLFAVIAGVALADGIRLRLFEADAFWPVTLMALGAVVVATAFLGRSGRDAPDASDADRATGERAWDDVGASATTADTSPRSTAPMRPDGPASPPDPSDR